MAKKAKWLCLGLCLIAASVAAQGTPVATTFSMTSAQVEPGGSFVLDINMADNNIAIAGFRIPLKFNENYLHVDSVSFVGSDLPATALVQGVVDDTGYINIVFCPPPAAAPRTPCIPRPALSPRSTAVPCSPPLRAPTRSTRLIPRSMAGSS